MGKKTKYYDIRKVKKLDKIYVYRIRRSDYRFRLEAQLSLYEDLLVTANMGYSKKELVKYIKSCIQTIKEILGYEESTN